MLAAVDHPALGLIWDPANASILGETPVSGRLRHCCRTNASSTSTPRTASSTGHTPTWGPLGEMARGLEGADRRRSCVTATRGAISLETHWRGPNGDRLEASTHLRAQPARRWSARSCTRRAARGPSVQRAADRVRIRCALAHDAIQRVRVHHNQTAAARAPAAACSTASRPTTGSWSIIASCGWLFDCMDQRLFILGARAGAARAARRPIRRRPRTIKTLSGYATTSMILGWATGGIIFGMMSDRLGRVKTMVVTLRDLLGVHRAVRPRAVLGGLHHLPVPGRPRRRRDVRRRDDAGGRERAGGSSARWRWARCRRCRRWATSSARCVSLVIPPGAANFFGGYSGWRVLFFVGIVPVPPDRADHLRAQGAGVVAARQGGGGGGRRSRPDHRIAVRVVPTAALAP